MDKFVISEELYEEIRLQPKEKLISAALYSREKWLADPYDGGALLSFLVMKDVLAERGVELPHPKDKDTLKRALSTFYSKMDGANF